MRYHFIFTKILTKRDNITSTGEDMEISEPTYNVYNGAADFGKQSGSSSSSSSEDVKHRVIS